MTDLTNPFPSHGSTGTKPPNGLNKSGGDQYEAEYFDNYANSWDNQAQEKNNAITRRVSHLSGDRILDGLGVTNSSGRTIDIGSSTGAYVNGQFTGTIDSRSLTLSSNSSGSERTDSVYVDSDGNMSTKTGTTTVPSSTYKIAEVDISTNNIITSIRDVGLQRTKHGVASDRPSGTIGNTLYHEGGSPTGRDGKGTYEVYDGTEWRELLFADGRQERTDHQYYGGNNIYDVGNLYFDDGDTSLDDVFVNESGDTMTGDLGMNTNDFTNVGSVQFNSVSGTALDLTTNADGDHYLWQHADDNGNTSDSHLNVGNGDIQRWRYNESIKHRFNVQGKYINAGGADLHGDLNMSDNIVSGIEFLKFEPDSAQYIDFDSSAGTFGWRDVNNDGLAYSYHNKHRFRTGQTRFEGGSVYLGQTSGDTNDSYDLVWENEPSGKDFRIHLKEDPNNSSLEGHIGMLFSNNGQGPIIACDVDSQTTYVEELRSKRDNHSGTPIARAYLGNDSNVGEIWYDPGAGEFRGKRAGGEVVQFGEPV